MKILNLEAILKNFLIKNLFYIIYIFTYFFICLSLINNFNDSVIQGFKLIFLILLIILFIGTLISKIIFKIKIRNKKIEKLTTENFEKKDLLNRIKLSLIFLFIYFVFIYLIFYFFCDKIFGSLPIALGIINSCKYISKIYFLSLPIYSFELVFLEYCSFMNSLKLTIILKCLKIASFSILASLITNFFKFNGFLYSKLIIDMAFFIYATIQLKKVIYLCQNKEG